MHALLIKLTLLSSPKTVFVLFFFIKVLLLQIKASYELQNRALIRKNDELRYVLTEILPFHYVTQIAAHEGMRTLLYRPTAPQGQR